MNQKKISILIAYLGVIFIWSSTPTTIRWSHEGIDSYTALFLRVGVAALLAFLLATLFNKRPVWNKPAILHYLAGNIGASLSLLFTYFSSHHVAPGIISIVYGLSPLLTGILSLLFLKEKKIASHEWLAFIVGLAGLLIIFIEEFFEHSVSPIGFGIIFSSVFLHAISTVLVKRYPLAVHPLTSVTGTLILSLPFMAALALLNLETHQFIPSVRAFFSSLYLSLFGSLGALWCLFYLLKNLNATTVNLATLITPILGLFFSVYFNHDTFGADTYIGTFMIISALSLYLYGHKLSRPSMGKSK
jgi:drug/metabolite transporter (DMT)-like permease